MSKFGSHHDHRCNIASPVLKYLLVDVMATRRQPEQSLQRTVADFLALCVPPPPIGCWWTAVNPMPYQSKAAAGISKAMGLRAGTPDLLMCWKGRLVGIELKTKGGRLNSVQRDAHEAITLSGGVVTTCRSLEEVADFLDVLGVPTRRAA